MWADWCKLAQLVSSGTLVPSQQGHKPQRCLYIHNTTNPTKNETYRSFFIVRWTWKHIRSMAPTLLSFSWGWRGSNGLPWFVTSPPITYQWYSTTSRPSAITPMGPLFCWPTTSNVTWKNRRDTPVTSKAWPPFRKQAWSKYWPISSWATYHGIRVEGPGACFTEEEKSDHGWTKFWLHTSIYSITCPSSIWGITPTTSWSVDASGSPHR